MKLNDKIIAALEKKGFNRWTKGNMDRLYINASMLGLELTYYKTGNVSGAWFNGEEISNTRGREYKEAKTYINIETGAVISSVSTLKDAAQELLEKTIAEVESAEATESNTEGNSDNSLSEMSDQEIIDYYRDQYQRLTHEPAFWGEATLTAQERDAILDIMHDVRMEMWGRESILSRPKAEDRSRYERNLQRNRERLEQATETGKLGSIYAMKNMVRESEDKLMWIDR